VTGYRVTFLTMGRRSGTQIPQQYLDAIERACALGVVALVCSDCKFFCCVARTHSGLKCHACGARKWARTFGVKSIVLEPQKPPQKPPEPSGAAA